MKRVLSVLLMAAVLMNGLNYEVFAKEEISFPDISTDYWAYNNIKDLTNMGVINGYPDGNFHPTDTLTIEQFLKMVAGVVAYRNSLNEEEVPSFEVGANERWSQPYIDYLYDLSIIPSNENFFGVSFNGNITREWMSYVSVMADRATHYTQLTVDDEIEESITDSDEISNDMKDYVFEAYAMGILTGYTDGSFKPSNVLTRVEGTAVAMRIYDLNNRKPYLSFRPYEAKELLQMDEYKAKVWNYNESYSGDTEIEINDNGTITYYFEWRDVKVNYTLDKERSALILGAFEALVPNLSEKFFIRFDTLMEFSDNTVNAVGFSIVNDYGYVMIANFYVPLDEFATPNVNGFNQLPDFNIKIKNLGGYDPTYEIPVGEQHFDTRFMTYVDLMFHGIFGADYLTYTEYVYDRVSHPSDLNDYAQSSPLGGDIKNVGNYKVDTTLLDTGFYFGFTSK